MFWDVHCSMFSGHLSTSRSPCARTPKKIWAACLRPQATPSPTAVNSSWPSCSKRPWWTCIGKSRKGLLRSKRLLCKGISRIRLHRYPALGRLPPPPRSMTWLLCACWSMPDVQRDTARMTTANAHISCLSAQNILFQAEHPFIAGPATAAEVDDGAASLYDVLMECRTHPASVSLTEKSHSDAGERASENPTG